MDNLEDVPRLLGELSLPAFDNKNVFMWECPDLLNWVIKMSLFGRHKVKIEKRINSKIIIMRLMLWVN